MILAHLSQRRRVTLLAAGVLEGRERAETLAHVEACARCRAEHDELRALLLAIERDPVRDAEPGLPLPVLVARVEREVERAFVAPSGRPRFWLVALPAAAAVLAVAAIVPTLVARFRPEAVVSSPVPGVSTAAVAPTVSAEVLDRLERNVARAHAARYLSDAGDVLVAVAATGADCERAADTVDVGEAPDRSRQLLAQRALVVETGGEAVASARGVLDDVEQALREVAELPSCVRRSDVARVRQQVERERLLMRIRLMTRELEG
jgi:hypothetical protein